MRTQIHSLNPHVHHLLRDLEHHCQTLRRCLQPVPHEENSYHVCDAPDRGVPTPPPKTQSLSLCSPPPRHTASSFPPAARAALYCPDCPTLWFIFRHPSLAFLFFFVLVWKFGSWPKNTSLYYDVIFAWKFWVMWCKQQNLARFLVRVLVTSYWCKIMVLVELCKIPNLASYEPDQNSWWGS